MMGGRSYRKVQVRKWWHLDRIPRIRSWLLAIGAILFYFEMSLLPYSLFSLNNIQSVFLGNFITGILLFWLYKRRKFGISDPAPEIKPTRRTYVLWVAAFVASTFFLELLFHFMNSRITDTGMEARADTIASDGVLLFAFMAVFVAPLAEEIMMRLFCYNVLRSSCSRLTATLGSGFLFGAIHGTVTHMLVASILGCILALSYEATGKWFMPVIGHYVYNTMVLFCFGEAVLSLTDLPGFMVFDVAMVSLLVVLCGRAAWCRTGKELS